MKVEPISGNAFMLDLDATEFSCLLELSEGVPGRMAQVVKLWVDIGYLTSRNISEKVVQLCKLKESQNANSS